MRRTCSMLLAAVAMTLLFPLLGAQAAPRDLTRPSDGNMSTCREGRKCVARAVGDFNGDGMDDILFERMATDNAPVPTFTPNHQFDLNLSPFTLVAVPGRDLPERSAASHVTFIVDSNQLIEPVSVADLDGDGLSDLLFNTLPFDNSGQQHAKVLVMRGRPDWKRAYNLSNPANVDFRITPQVTSDRTTPFALLTSGVADLNGDGKNDLVLSLDTALNDPRRPVGVDKVPGPDRRSEVMVLFYSKGWLSAVNQAPDVLITNLGGCAGGFAGSADVTGDGRTDLVLRRCVPGLPTTLRVLPGRTNWPKEVALENPSDLSAALVSGSGLMPAPRVDEPLPNIGRGYAVVDPVLSIRMPEQFVLDDFNGDEITDMGIELTGKTHVWFGGPTIVERAAANRTSAVILKAGYGALPLTRSWKMFDLDGDGEKDLLLSRPVDRSLLACPDGSCQGNILIQTQPDVSGRPVYVFGEGTASRRVLDVDVDQADVMWNEPDAVIWGMGDFNGDGHEDLLLGSPPGAADSIYHIVSGPLKSGQGN